MDNKKHAAELTTIAKAQEKREVDLDKERERGREKWQEENKKNMKKKKSSSIGGRKIISHMSMQ